MSCLQRPPTCRLGEDSSHRGPTTRFASSLERGPRCHAWSGVEAPPKFLSPLGAAQHVATGTVWASKGKNQTELGTLLSHLFVFEATAASQPDCQGAGVTASSLLQRRQRAVVALASGGTVRPWRHRNLPVVTWRHRGRCRLQRGPSKRTPCAWPCLPEEAAIVPGSEAQAACAHPALQLRLRVTSPQEVPLPVKDGPVGTCCHRLLPNCELTPAVRAWLDKRAPCLLVRRPRPRRRRTWNMPASLGLSWAVGAPLCAALDLLLPVGFGWVGLTWPWSTCLRGGPKETQQLVSSSPGPSRSPSCCPRPAPPGGLGRTLSPSLWLSLARR